MALNIGDIALPESSVSLTAFKTPGVLDETDDGNYIFNRKGKCPFGKTISCTDCTNFVMNYPDVTEVGLIFPRIICTDLDLAELRVSKPIKTTIKMRRSLRVIGSFVIFVNWRDIDIGYISLTEEGAKEWEFTIEESPALDAIKAKIIDRISSGRFYLSFSNN